MAIVTVTAALKKASLCRLGHLLIVAVSLSRWNTTRVMKYTTLIVRLRPPVRLIWMATDLSQAMRKPKGYRSTAIRCSRTPPTLAQTLTPLMKQLGWFTQAGTVPRLMASKVQ